MRTDEQIVAETNELARYLCAELIGTGYQVPEDHKFYEAEDPRSKAAWSHAVKIMEMTTATEVSDALETVLIEDEPRRYRAPNGFEIVGTSEKVLGNAIILGILRNGDPVYKGETKVDWDTQQTLMMLSTRGTSTRSACWRST